MGFTGDVHLCPLWVATYVVSQGKDYGKFNSGKFVEDIRQLRKYIVISSYIGGIRKVWVATSNVDLSILGHGIHIRPFKLLRK